MILSSAQTITCRNECAPCGITLSDVASPLWNGLKSKSVPPNGEDPFSIVWSPCSKLRALCGAFPIKILSSFSGARPPAPPLSLGSLLVCITRLIAYDVSCADAGTEVNDKTSRDEHLTKPGLRTQHERQSDDTEKCFKRTDEL